MRWRRHPQDAPPSRRTTGQGISGGTQAPEPRPRAGPPTTVTVLASHAALGTCRPEPALGAGAASTQRRSPATAVHRATRRGDNAIRPLGPGSTRLPRRQHMHRRPLTRARTPRTADAASPVGQARIRHGCRSGGGTPIELAAALRRPSRACVLVLSRRAPGKASPPPHDGAELARPRGEVGEGGGGGG